MRELLRACQEVSAFGLSVELQPEARAARAAAEGRGIRGRARFHLRVSDGGAYINCVYSKEFPGRKLRYDVRVCGEGKRRLFADVPGPLFADCRVDVEDVSVWPAVFCETVSWALSMRIALALAKDNGVASNCNGMYLQALGRALCECANEPDMPMDGGSSWLEARGNMNLYQGSFVTGEITLDRVLDLQRYQSSAAKLKNFTCHVYGGISRRPGTIYLGDVKYPAKKCRLIPFEYKNASNQTYAMEFGDFYIRFWTHDGVIADEDGEIYEVESPYAEDELREITWVQSADTVFLFHPSHQPQKLVRYGHADWEIADFVTSGGPYMDENTSEITITPSVGDDGETVTLTASGELFTSRHVGREFRIRQRVSREERDGRGGLGDGGLGHARPYVDMGRLGGYNYRPGAYRLGLVERQRDYLQGSTPTGTGRRYASSRSTRTGTSRFRATRIWISRSIRSSIPSART